MPRVPPRRRPARPARDRHRIGRLEARLAVETDARRALADRVELLEVHLEAAAARLEDVVVAVSDDLERLARRSSRVGRGA